MKKLKMIVTSVIVLAIVGSAFAFKVKKGGTFCVLEGTSGTNCTTFKTGFKITTTGLFNDYKYIPCWDGNRTACTATNNGLCTATGKLAVD